MQTEPYNSKAMECLQQSGAFLSTGSALGFRMILPFGEEFTYLRVNRLLPVQDYGNCQGMKVAIATYKITDCARLRQVVGCLRTCG